MKLLSSSVAFAQIDTLVGQSNVPLIVILGPTAGGKTALSIDVAKYIGNAEIINADSRQLYRYLTIGTAKITEEDMQGVKHHLLDILDPSDEVTIADFKEMVTRVVDDCHRRNVVPILVGGSMLYVSAVVDGLEPLPSAPPELRKRLEEEYEKDDGWEMYDKLMEIDPATGRQFQAQNKHYLVRAMELYEMTGKRPSELKKTVPPPYDVMQIGVFWEREPLVERIDRRVKMMLDAGWIEEVEGLLDKGYTVLDPAMKSHGYKEIMQWLSSEEKNIEELAEVIARKTRSFAKRQMTWWGNDERITWVDGAQL